MCRRQVSPIALLLFLAAPGIAGAACSPGTNQIAIFVDANYSGQCAVLNVADYPNANSFGLPNDSISSVLIGPNARAVLCRDDNFGGVCQTVTANISDMNGQPVGNDSISSIRVQQINAPPACTPGANQASFFVNAAYGGQCVVLGFGNYPNATTIGLPNDSISSVEVAPSAQAVVCRDDDFGGLCETIMTNITDMTTQPVGNDTISSLRVQQRGTVQACPPAANQVSFFVDANLTGQCNVLGPGDYPNAGKMGLPNDSISSIQVGASAQAIVCRNDNYGTPCQTVTANILNMSGQPVGNDAISSVHVQARGAPPPCTPAAGSASFFVDAQFGGVCVNLKPGDYETADAIGLPNDSISSVEIGPNTQAYVCRDNLFAGVCQTISTNIADLGNQPVGNDQISSLKVQAQGTANSCIPGANQAGFFTGTDYDGSCSLKGIGDYPDYTAFGLPNDSINSLQIGTGAQALICQDEVYGGQCQTVTANMVNLNGQPVGGGQISSIKVQPRGAQNANCVPGASQVAFFVDSQFRGTCTIKDAGDYLTAEEIGLPNDSISSLRVGGSAQTNICADSNLQGNCETVNQDVSDLAADRVVGNDQISSLQVQARTAGGPCEPGANQVALFMDTQFSGPCAVKGLGGYPNPAAIGLPNDSVSSIKVGSNVEADVCSDDSYQGTCEAINGNVPDLGPHPVGNDTISSVRVQPTACKAGVNQAAFFVNADFSGGCSVLNLGDYPDAASIGLPNDSISSIRLGPKVQAWVCQNDDFGGVCQVTLTDIANMTGTQVGNDQISSLKVQPMGTPETCTPGPAQASFYTAVNFGGVCVTKGAGDYGNASAFGLPNDSIQSVRVGQTAQAWVCRDGFFGGVCQRITADASDLSGQTIGQNTISSLKVQPRGMAENCAPGPNQASFFGGANFTGPCIVRGVGEYPNDVAMGLANDSIVSVEVSSGVQVYLCRDGYYGTPCQTITANTASLPDQPVGAKQASSFKVMPLGAPTACQPGANQVAFFTDANFQNGCVVRGLGAYPNAAAVGLADHSISSIKVGPGAQAFVCPMDGFHFLPVFSPPCQTIVADAPDLGQQPIGNDHISSARVQIRVLPSCDPVFFPGCQNPAMNGFVDLHTHPLSNLGFSGKLIYGGPDIGSLLPSDPNCNAKAVAASMEQALGHDGSTHSAPVANGTLACGDYKRMLAVHMFQSENAAADESADSSGAPDFPEWPVWNDITHQKMWIDWIQRAYAGGLRVMVALSVNNKTLADTFAGKGDGPDDDKATGDIQLDHIRNFVARHNDFMEIALNSGDVQRIVQANRLAVVMGVEIDNIGNLNGVSPVTNEVIGNEIDRLYGEGVRYIFPIHVLDNAAGGTAVYIDTFNYSNYREAGHFWDLKCADQPGDITEQVTHRYSYSRFMAILSAVLLGTDANVLLGAPTPSCPSRTEGGRTVQVGHQNSAGLTPVGEYALRKMMSLGMLIDIDHMSQMSADRALAIADAVPNGGYPLNSGHNGRRGHCGQNDDVNENSRTVSQLQQIGAHHGMVGVGSANLDAQQWLGCYYQEVSQLGLGGAGGGFGTDTDGLVAGMKPRPGSQVVYSAAFPKSESGNRQWDYNYDGVAHYGMIYDFLQDARGIPASYATGGNSGADIVNKWIMTGAKYFIDTWKKAEAQKGSVTP
jgi:microsomal dipeptidase-like Zn-dependent dipeptidase